MLEIIIEPRRTFNLRQAIADAVENGDYDGLCDDIRDCFSDDQVDQVEEVLESGDIAEAIDEIVSEWNAEDVDDLIDTMETYFAESSIELQFLLDADFDEDAPEDSEEFDLFDDDSEDEGGFDEEEENL
jgi:hypothetical protein